MCRSPPPPPPPPRSSGFFGLARLSRLAADRTKNCVPPPPPPPMVWFGLTPMDAWMHLGSPILPLGYRFALKGAKVYPAEDAKIEEAGLHPKGIHNNICMHTSIPKRCKVQPIVALLLRIAPWGSRKRGLI